MDEFMELVDQLIEELTAEEFIALWDEVEEQHSMEEGKP